MAPRPKPPTLGSTERQRQFQMAYRRTTPTICSTWASSFSHHAFSQKYFELQRHRACSTVRWRATEALADQACVRLNLHLARHHSSYIFPSCSSHGVFALRRAFLGHKAHGEHRVQLPPRFSRSCGGSTDCIPSQQAAPRRTTATTCYTCLCLSFSINTTHDLLVFNSFNPFP